MFKNFLSFWKGKDFLARVFEQFKNMLDDAEAMFTAVCARLPDNADEPGLVLRQEVCALQICLQGVYLPGSFLKSAA